MPCHVCYILVKNPLILQIISLDISPDDQKKIISELEILVRVRAHVIMHNNMISGLSKESEEPHNLSLLLTFESITDLKCVHKEVIA